MLLKQKFSCVAFKVQIIESMFSFLLNLMFWATSLLLNKLHMLFKHMSWPSFNHWNFVACIRFTNPFHNSANTICCLLVICFKSTNKCCMSDAPPSSLMDSTVSPNVTIMEGEGVGARSLAWSTSGVKGCARAPGWGLRWLTSKSITYTNLHKPNNKLVNV